MEDMKDTGKRKFTIYLKREDATKLSDLLARVLEREPRTNMSEIVRELLGFPPKYEGAPIVTDDDRGILSGSLAPERQHGPYANKVRPTVTSIVKSAGDNKKKTGGI